MNFNGPVRSMWRILAQPRMGGFLILAFLGGCQKLEAGYCQWRLPATHLSVSASLPEYDVTHHFDARALGDAHGADGERITYGLTSAQTSVLAEVKMHVLKVPGGVCVRPDLAVQVGYRPMRVDIARELASGSCEYQTVLGHELKHVDVFKQQLASTVKLLQHEIEERGVGTATRYTDVEQADAAMRRLQDDWLVPRGEALLGEVAQLQRLVDTPSEYQRVAGACGADSLISGHATPEH